jgi:hypothetical protein
MLLLCVNRGRDRFIVGATGWLECDCGRNRNGLGSVAAVSVSLVRHWREGVWRATGGTATRTGDGVI